MANGTIEVRPARAADAAAVAALLSGLGYPQDAAAAAARIGAWAADPLSEAFAAVADGEVAGVIAVHAAPYFERAGSWGRIVALVVADSARGRGVGGALVAAAEAFAVERGCVRMEVTSADRREDAHAFYASRGYTVQTGVSSRFLRDLTAAAAAPP
ncbi:hypothetical protein GCM10009830_05390 [Glycomyces endophyticus]|uniref:N-acetyltransferase domain-containing protein n=1 Tax=Glycomyces endophyticus TaxID=480996 RepID=A0ABN2G0S1_9ACTN